MDARVRWERELQFTGMANSGFAVRMDSNPSPETGVSPVEMVAMALAGCTAMDVISILGKQRQVVVAFDVLVHAERATDYPRVITKAVLDYVVVGHGVQESALITAIDKSVKKYCPVHAMLKHAFPIDLHYTIREANGSGESTLVIEGLLEE